MKQEPSKLESKNETWRTETKRSDAACLARALGASLDCLPTSEWGQQHRAKIEGRKVLAVLQSQWALKPSFCRWPCQSFHRSSSQSQPQATEKGGQKQHRHYPCVGVDSRPLASRFVCALYVAVCRYPCVSRPLCPLLSRTVEGWTINYYSFLR